MTGAARAGATALALALLLMGTPTAATARLCLPPIFEGGQRLHPLPVPSVFWLPLLLRQHELCWYGRDDEQTLRVALFGNSAAYGLPLPAEQTWVATINRHFVRSHLPAHAFNLAWICPYQIRDATILQAALPYHPDVVVFDLTLDDFGHQAPIMYPPALVEFFKRNSDVLAAMVADPPAGLEEPMNRYGRWLDRQPPLRGDFERLRDVGRFLRVTARHHARALAARLHVVLRPDEILTAGRKQTYECPRTIADNAKRFANFQTWNVLAHLQEIRDQLGIDVVVVNWPIAHEPVGNCYNVRYGAAMVAEFNEWLRAQSTARGLAYLDLHDLLRPEEFFDSLHPTAAGHQRIAERLAATLDPILRKRMAPAVK